MQRLSGADAGRNAVALSVDDLQGRRLCELAAAGPLTRLQLAPGTYVITARSTAVRRDYRLTLAPGARCELHLKMGTDRR